MLPLATNISNTGSYTRHSRVGEDTKILRSKLEILYSESSLEGGSDIVETMNKSLNLEDSLE